MRGLFGGAWAAYESCLPPVSDAKRGAPAVTRANYFFTSESVSEGHPDKVCDRISDEVVDLFFRESVKHGFAPKDIRVGCETLCTTNRVVIAGETRGPKGINGAIEEVARAAIREIGY